MFVLLTVCFGVGAGLAALLIAGLETEDVDIVVVEVAGQAVGFQNWLGGL